MIVLPVEAFQDYVVHPQVKRLYLTDVGFFPHALCHDRERKEGIEEYIFIYCMEGSGVIELHGGDTYELHANEAFCIPRLCGHHYFAHPDDPWSILWVHLKGDDLAFYPLDSPRVIRFLSPNAPNRMLNLFELLFRTLEGSYTLGNFIYLSQVLSLILSETYLLEQPDAAPEQNRHVTNIIRYLYRHLDEEITLETLSERFELSKSYLNAVFQKCTQHAPLDFFIRLKIKEACKLLRSTDLYIYEVARRVGYQDPYYFSRIFKKIVGVSPKDYRENVLIP